MLKITMTKTPAEERWILHGRLVGPWVRELQAVWRNTHRADEQQRCVFDLNDVTFVDKGGETLLRALAKEGVQFEASGIYVRDVVKQLKGKRNARRGELLVCLLVTLLSGAVDVANRISAGPNIAVTNRNQCIRQQAYPRNSNWDSTSGFGNEEGEMLCPQES
jgi:predicted nucleic acid-binding Zn ribbon protein